MNKNVLIVIGLSCISIIVIFICFVGGVTSTYPPIRQYGYLGTTSQLVTDIRKYTLVDSDITFKITDTTGSEKNGYAIYMQIEAKNIEYNLLCEEQGADIGKTTVNLVGVYDKIQNIGGYSKEAKDIDLLVSKFASTVLKPLKDTQNIQITPL